MLNEQDHPAGQESAGQPATEQQPPPTREPDILPDEVKDEPKLDSAELAKLQQQYESEKQALAEKVRKAEEDKESFAKRLKDSQEYISRTRNIEKDKPPVDIPRKTFEEYKEEVKEKFRNDPVAGIDKIITDVAY